MYPPLELIHKRCTSLVLSQTQVDVPSTCTTKDVPSNVLRQRSQAVKPLILCEWGYKRILRREKGDTKEFREKRMKRMNSTSFQGLENQKTSESFWYKEEEEVQRDSRLVKD
ncbi:hypothetical protein HKD37_08G023192 [Glycine soja]